MKLFREGKYDRAIPLAERALAIWEKALGPEHPDVATSLNNLALLYKAKGDYARAEPLYQRALAIREKALGPEHPDVAESLNNLAVLYNAKGDYARAEPLYQRALAIREKALGPEHPDVANSLNNLAALYEEKRDYARAEPLFQRALAIREKALGPDHPDVATSLSNLALLYEARGEVAKAIGLEERAQEILEHNLGIVLASGSEPQKRAYMSTLTGTTEAAVSLHARSAPDSPAALRLALTTVLRRKGRVLEAVAEASAGSRGLQSPEDRALWERLGATRAELASLVLRGPGPMPLETYRAQIGKLDEETQRLESTLSARNAEFRSQVEPVTIERVQAALPRDARLVEIFAYRPFDPKTAEWGSPRYVAYVLAREGPARWLVLGEAAEIDQQVTKLRTALSDPASPDVTALARALDEKLMRPLRPLLGEAHQVLISPDGALNLVPFEALVDEQGHYLVERYDLSYLSSGRDLLRLGPGKPPQEKPLVVANPSFDATGSPGTVQVVDTRGTSAVANRRSSDFGALRFGPLSGTAAEAKALGALLPGATLLTGGEASEAALKQVHSPRLLHIATHGFFLADQREDPSAMRRGFQLASGESLPAPAASSENPLLRSGLALAGANRRESTGGEDGILTALEASGLDLVGTRLVVLSACETGVGAVRNGDGVYGLRRAFVIAGAQSQLLSLWKVDDLATTDLMVAFYRRLLAKEARSEALRQVQLEMLHSANHSHPFYWAAFILSGAVGPME